MASLGADFEFALAGEYNVWNATAAAAMAPSYGISETHIAGRAEDLQEREAAPGSEGRGEWHHHHRRLRASSDCIAGTLTALRARYPGARLWVDSGTTLEHTAAQCLSGCIGEQSGAGG